MKVIHLALFIVLLSPVTSMAIPIDWTISGTDNPDFNIYGGFTYDGDLDCSVDPLFVHCRYSNISITTEVNFLDSVITDFFSNDGLNFASTSSNIEVTASNGANLHMGFPSLSNSGGSSDCSALLYGASATSFIVDGNCNLSSQQQSVPEPRILALMSLGLIGLFAARRKK